MKLKNLVPSPIAVLILLVLILLVPATAFAQTSDPSAISPLWVSLAALIVGYLTHAYQTGEVFGQRTIPKTWLPYVGAAVTFGTAFLAALPSGGNISKTAIEAAALAGLQNLITLAIGAAGHVLQTAHKSSRGVAAGTLTPTVPPTVPPAPPANDVVKSVPPAAVVLLMLLGLQNQACISSAPIVPITSANQAQVTSCQNTASLHNTVVIGGFVLSGSGAALAGTAAAVPDSNASLKTDLAIAGAFVGGFALIDAAVAELSNSNFQNSKCGDVVGPLPTAPAPKPAPAATEGH